MAAGSLLDAEEVLDLELSVLGKVRAMNSIMRPCVAKLGSQGVWPQVLGNLGVHRANKLPEGLHCVLLSDLHDDAGTQGHGLDHAHELGQHSLVDLEELLGCWLVKCEHLH